MREIRTRAISRLSGGAVQRIMLVGECHVVAAFTVAQLGITSGHCPAVITDSNTNIGKIIVKYGIQINTWCPRNNNMGDFRPPLRLSWTC